MTEPFDDIAPSSDTLTEYDRAHVRLYTRLLDAAAEGAAWQEIVAILFGMDPGTEPDRSRQVYDSHLARARWMSETGFRLLLGERPISN